MNGPERSHTPFAPYALADRYAALGESSRKAIKIAESADDQDTMDVFVDVSRDLDK